MFGLLQMNNFEFQKALIEETEMSTDADGSSENVQQQWPPAPPPTPSVLIKTPTKGILLQTSRYVLLKYIKLTLDAVDYNIGQANESSGLHIENVSTLLRQYVPISNI